MDKMDKKLILEKPYVDPYRITKAKALELLARDPKLRGCDTYDLQQIVELTGSKEAIKQLRKKSGALTNGK